MDRLLSMPVFLVAILATCPPYMPYISDGHVVLSLEEQLGFFCG